MRKILLVGAIALAPLAAFATGPGPRPGGHDGGSSSSIVGGGNLSHTEAGSSAGVSSTQGTAAGVKAGGTGGVAVGAVSGNMSEVNTSASGKAGPGGSSTETSASQYNVGGTGAAGIAINKSGHGGPGDHGGPSLMDHGGGQYNSGGATGVAGGYQNSQTTGSADADASNTNFGGFIKKETSGGGGHPGGPGHGGH